MRHPPPQPALENWLKASDAGDENAMAAAESGICFNGGGHVNHAIFWENMAPQGSGGGAEPSGALAEAINKEFGSFQVRTGPPVRPSCREPARWLGLTRGAFPRPVAAAQSLKEKFNATTAPIQGSGWGWLAYDKNADKVTIVTRPNQDVPETLGVEPLLGVDVWEHAYCAWRRRQLLCALRARKRLTPFPACPADLQYKNLRPDYLKAIWEVIDFKDVEARFEAARK